MFVLERLVFQGLQTCPQYRWVQYALCGNRSLLERVRSAQRQPEDWRVTALAANTFPADRMEKQFRRSA